MIKFVPLKWMVRIVGFFVLLPYLVLEHYMPSAQPLGYINNFSKSVLIAVMLLGVINAFGLWRWVWRMAPRWFNTNIFPDLQGTYEGTLISSWNGGTTIPGAKLIIKQTLTYIKIKQITGESVSYSKIADIVHFDRDINIFKLYYIYFNEPRNSVQDRSLPHIGAADLYIKIGKEVELQGRYFNDPVVRATTGEMAFTRINRNADF